MGSTSYLTKPKSAGYRIKSGSSAGSDKEINGKLKRNKMRRPVKMSEYGMKRVPDYTDMAYKEAVSKLRYFLSGNYAPSVRSYGGSASIKNLDESDGDLDKKYSPYSHTLAEYKPRPRLTAKYTSLYADSLNNYTPPVNTGPVSAGADVTGGTNPDVVNFIQKQEEYIEQLERESQYCRDELNNLLGKVKEVISENENLHEAQKNKIISRMFHSCGSETDELDDSTGLDSDNKISPSKVRKGSRPRSTRLEGPNIVFESRIAELEAQLAQSKIDLKKVQDENNENKRKLASGLVDSTCLDGFKRQIDNLQRDKSTLESQIAKLKFSLENKDDGYKRNDAIETQLRDERNNLEAEMRRIKDELSKERSKVRELTSDGARRALQERSAAEMRHNQHADQLQAELAVQYDNVAKLQLDLDRQRRDENDLKREISMKNSAIEELKMEIKNKTSSLQADLSQAHAEKASLEEELASARLAMERHQRQAKHDANRLNSEIQSLRQRLDRADADVVHARRENLRLSEQISTLEKELNMKTLTPISPEKNKKEKELSTILESMENKHAKTVAELESMIQSQNSLMEKLTGECRLLTDKLDDANRRHKQELATLQRQVDSLGRSFQSPRTTPSTYQAPTTHSPATNRVVPTEHTTGPLHPGTESPRHPPLSPPHRPLGTHGQHGRDGHDNQTTRQLTKEPSRTSLYNQTADHDTEDKDKEVVKESHEEMEVEQPQAEEYPQNYETFEQPQTAEGQEYEQNYEPQTAESQEYEQNYEQPHTVEGQEYEQNYEQPQIVEGQEYKQNYEQPQTVAGQEYEQNYEQPQTAEGQVYEQQNYEQPYSEEQYNYEQYPQGYDPNAQYQGDPNAQYEGNYENYATDGNYQGEQNYDAQSQETAQYQETPQSQETPQYQETAQYQETPQYQEGQVTKSKEAARQS